MSPIRDGSAKAPQVPRRALAGLLALCLTVTSRLGRAQDALPLRPGEAIEFGRLTMTALGLSIRRSERGANIALRLRVLNRGRGGSERFDSDMVRLFAGGVPRAPQLTRDGREVGSIYVASASAEDIDCTFTIPDLTDDLVIQVRAGEVIERRRLPPGAP